MEVSSAYFMIGILLKIVVQSLVKMEKRTGARTVLCGAPFFVINRLDRRERRMHKILKYKVGAFQSQEVIQRQADSGKFIA